MIRVGLGWDLHRLVEGRALILGGIVLPFEKGAAKPQFKPCAKHPHVEERGFVLFYTSQCPFNAKYVPIIERVAREQGVKFRAIHLQTRDEAQNAPTPITTYALFLDGEYLTNEQMNDARFLKLLAARKP